MLNKVLIKNKFSKSIKTYDDNAYIQNIISEKLTGYIRNKKYLNILEIGSYTGNLTKKIVELNPDFNKYLAVDIVEDSKNYLKKISPDISFVNCDIEDFETSEKFDLIISTSTLQWCFDLASVLKKLKSYLNKNGVLAVSVFKKGNLFEIKEAFDAELNYPDDEYIQRLKKNGVLSKKVLIASEKIPCKFKNSVEILRHLKYTGVNSIKKSYSITSIKKGLKILEEKYFNRITYIPLYIIDTTD